MDKTTTLAADDLRVTPSSVQTQVAQKLRSAILGGVFQPGDRLVEADLCDRMGVSRPSIREALRRLEAERLVTFSPNKGSTVAAISWDEAEEIYDVRAMLEGEAAYRAATQADAAAIDAMRAALAAFEKAVRAGDAAARVARTHDFYEALLGACGNRIIKDLLEGLAARINFLRARSMSRPGRAGLSAAEMRAMLSAIERHDKRAARAAAVEHVRRACESARAVFHPPETVV